MSFLVECSKMFHTAINYEENANRCVRKRGQTSFYVKRLIREIKNDPFKAATVLEKHLNITTLVISVCT